MLRTVISNNMIDITDDHVQPGGEATASIDVHFHIPVAAVDERNVQQHPHSEGRSRLSDADDSRRCSCYRVNGVSFSK